MRNRPTAKLSILTALVAGLVLLLALPGQAAAAKPCWKTVIDDWLASPNSTVTGTYKASCLQQALKNTPEDLRDYSNIIDAISAALQDALHGTKTSPPSTSPTTPTGTPSKANKNRRLQGGVQPSYFRRAINNLGPTRTDSMPIPLLVLAGLGTLLLLTAAGLAGAKRYRAVRGRPKPPPS